MIINRYLVREVASPLFAVTSVLVIVFMTYSLTVFLTDASQGLLGAGQIATLTVYKTLIALEVLLPIALYVAIILGMGRLYSDSEMDAVRAAGLGEARMLLPVLRLAALLALLVGLLSVWVRPMVYDALFTLKAQAEANSELDRIKAGRFYSYSDSGRTVFIEATDRKSGRLRGVFIRTRNAEGLQVITAREGRFLPQFNDRYHQLSLSDASVFKRTADGGDVFGQFGQFTVLLPIKQPEPVLSRPKLIPTLELGYAEPHERAELEWRLSTPLSTLLLAMLAIPLSRSRPRQGRYAQILVALVAYALYFNLLRMARNWVEQGSLGTIAWVPGALLVVVMTGYIPWRIWLRQAKARWHAPA